MTHLGQRLSALIDGELEGNERERVLVHMAKCSACRDEVAALRMLKRRMNALGDAAAGAALTGLTGRLLDELGRMAVWPSAQPACGPGQNTWPGTRAQDGWTSAGDPDARPGQSATCSVRSSAARYLLAGSLAVVLAGLGTAAFVAGGESPPEAPTRPVAPSVDVFVVPHDPATTTESASGAPAGPDAVPYAFRPASPLFKGTRGTK